MTRTAATVNPRCGQDSMLTFSLFASSEERSSSFGCVQRQWPNTLIAREMGWSSRFAYRFRDQNRKNRAAVYR